MAQVEIIMYVALGFATAALIALLLGRAMWTLAVGVGRRRAQRTAATPAVAELQAERNQLRAEYAMLARRVEVRLDDLKRQVAEHMAEVSRSRNRIDQLGTEIQKRDAILAERDSEIARLKEQIGILAAELTTRTTNLHELQDEHGKGGEAVAALRQQLAERDQQIERLSAEVDRLSVARSEAVSRERGVQDRLKERIEDLSALSRQIESQRRQLLVQQSQSQALRDTMTEQRQPEREQPERDEGAGEALPREPVTTGNEQQHGGPLERRMEDAERQASELQGELDRLDEIWAAKLADVARAVVSDPSVSDAADEPPVSEPLAGPAGVSDAAVVNGGAIQPVAKPMETAVEKSLDSSAPAEDDKRTGSGLANVISLAQRIRALQSNRS